ncbi:hypothetical protein [Sedimentibacter sp.]|uniref:hypothetical protein n=1 Tax=Sedimentibacter sp. TaxID=1960295 RepID=UPI002899E495|nr:hypothetical protein [Sedimentibacter sp.]
METELIQEVAQAVNSMSPEQFENLMDVLTTINNNIATTSNYIIFAVLLYVVWFTFKLLYGLFGHVFFGGI